MPFALPRRPRRRILQHCPAFICKVQCSMYYYLPTKVIFFGFIRLAMTCTSSLMPAKQVWLFTGR